MRKILSPLDGFASPFGPRSGPKVARILLSNSEIAENASVGDLVGTLSVINGSGPYSFAIKVGGDPDSKFSIDGVDDTRLELADTLDYETATSHSVTIEADNGVDPVIERTFTINVTDVDEIAPTITSANSANVDEGAQLAFALTANESVTWAITGGADELQFEISGSTLRWAENGSKDYEAPDDADTDNAYVVEVTATDLAGNASTPQTITITVNDVVSAVDDVDAYEARIVTAGGTLSTTQRNAVIDFVNTGVADGWYTKLIDCGLFLGSNLDAALVKLVAATGTGTSYVNNNFVSGDYTENGGLSLTGNATKYLGTGVIPGDHGLSAASISYGIGGDNGVEFNGQGLFGNAEADTGKTSVIGGVPIAGAIGHPDRNATSWAQAYCAAASYTGGNVYGVLDGIVNGESSSFTPTDTLDTEIFLFRIDKFGTQYLTGAGKISFFFIAEAMTKAELQSITAAANVLHRAARGITISTRDVFLGDSITFGQGTTSAADRWSNLVSTDLGTDQITNLAWSGTTALGDPSALERTDGTDLLSPVTRFFVMLGSNDVVYGEDNPTTIAAYKAMLASVASKLKAEGAEVVICSIPYKLGLPDATQLLWVDAALEAASDEGVIGVDLYRPMMAAEDPTVYLVDSVHLNDLGNEFVSELVLYALAGTDTTAPTITSSSSVSVNEELVLNHTLTANEFVFWSIIGGADQAEFELSGSTLRWASNGTKDYETPDDADTNNVYVVQVRATDLSGNTTNQTISVTVNDVVEGGGWTPADFGADLIGWYDAQDSGSITQSGGAVSQWNDLSGNGEHVVQATGSAQPTYGATSFSSSKPGIYFDGGDYLECSSFAGTVGGIVSVFIVGQMDSGTTDNGRVFCWYAGSGADFSNPKNFVINRSGNAAELITYRNANSSTKALSTGTPASFGAVINGDDITTYVDNAAGTTGTKSEAIDVEATTIYLGVGNQGSGPGAYWTGYICEVVVVKKALDSTERSQLDSYFATRWGL